MKKLIICTILAIITISCSNVTENPRISDIERKEILEKVKQDTITRVVLANENGPQTYYLVKNNQIVTKVEEESLIFYTLLGLILGIAVLTLLSLIFAD